MVYAYPYTLFIFTPHYCISSSFFFPLSLVPLVLCSSISKWNVHNASYSFNKLFYEHIIYFRNFSMCYWTENKEWFSLSIQGPVSNPYSFLYVLEQDRCRLWLQEDTYTCFFLSHITLLLPLPIDIFFSPPIPPSTFIWYERKHVC